MIETSFILLMFMSSNLEEYTVRESLTECLSTKRKIERQINGPEGKYRGTTRLSCKKFKVKIDKNGNIVEFVDGKPNN
jgi:hypothetical protein